MVVAASPDGYWLLRIVWAFGPDRVGILGSPWGDTGGAAPRFPSLSSRLVLRQTFGRPARWSGRRFWHRPRCAQGGAGSNPRQGPAGQLL